jgi:hypothetical protein
MKEGVGRNRGSSTLVPSSSASALLSSLSPLSWSCHSDISFSASSAGGGARLPTSVVVRKSSTGWLHLGSANRSRTLNRSFPLPLSFRTSAHRVFCCSFQRGLRTPANRMYSSHCNVMLSSYLGFRMLELALTIASRTFHAPPSPRRLAVNGEGAGLCTEYHSHPTSLPGWISFFLFNHFSCATYRSWRDTNYPLPVHCSRDGGSLQAPLCPPPRPAIVGIYVHSDDFPHFASPIPRLVGWLDLQFGPGSCRWHPAFLGRFQLHVSCWSSRGGPHGGMSLQNC